MQVPGQVPVFVEGVKEEEGTLNHWVGQGQGLCQTHHMFDPVKK